VFVYACAIMLEQHRGDSLTARVSLLKMTLSLILLIPAVENVFAMHSISILTSSRASRYGL
jgi:hypothetical protein